MQTDPDRISNHQLRDGRTPRHPPAIEINGLRWQYEHNAGFALSIPELQICAGECVGLVGGNGSGKTTLINCLNGLVPRAHTGTYAGSVRLFGQDLIRVSPAQFRGLVGTVFSDPECQFTTLTIEEEIVFGLENLGLDYATVSSRVATSAERLGLTDLLQKSVFEISGGQKQRVALASVLAMMPRLLLLDEPTSMLDPATRHEMFDHFREIKEQGDITILVAEHNLEYLAPFVDRFLYLENGAIIMDAPPRDLFKRLIEDSKPADIAIPDVTLFCGWLRGRGVDVGLAIEFSDGIRRIQRALDAP